MFFQKKKKEKTKEPSSSPKIQTAEGWKRAQLKKNKKDPKKG